MLIQLLFTISCRNKNRVSLRRINIPWKKRTDAATDSGTETYVFHTYLLSHVYFPFPSFL